MSGLNGVCIADIVVYSVHAVFVPLSTAALASPPMSEGSVDIKVQVLPCSPLPASYSESPPTMIQQRQTSLKMRL